MKDEGGNAAATVLSLCLTPLKKGARGRNHYFLLFI